MSIFAIDEDRCLNYNYKISGCRRCRDVCPQACWDDTGRIDARRCDACGLCQAVCPVDAIGVEGVPVTAWNEVTGKEGDLHLSCRRYSESPLACLGFVNARDLIALAWQETDKKSRDVFVCDNRCRECKSAVAEHLEKEIAAAQQFLSYFGAGRVLHGEKMPLPASESKEIGRRAFFSSLFSTGVETVRNVMWPEDGVVPLAKAQWRGKTLRGRGNGEASAPQKVFPVLSIAQNCIACGLCAKMCPVKALTAEEKGTVMELSHSPLLCTGCGLCAEHCPEGSILMLQEGELNHRLLIAKEFPRCNECGEAFQPAGRQLTCFECLMKGRRSLFEPSE